MRPLPLLLLVLVIAIGCGSKQPAPAGTTSSGSTSAQAPAVTPDDPSCPPSGQETAAVGTSCPTEGATCGHAAAAAATGFSNVLSCTGGTWKNYEVPPPAPAP